MLVCTLICCVQMILETTHSAQIKLSRKSLPIIKTGIGFLNLAFAADKGNSQFIQLQLLSLHFMTTFVPNTIKFNHCDQKASPRLCIFSMLVHYHKIHAVWITIKPASLRSNFAFRVHLRQNSPKISGIPLTQSK